MKWALSRQYLGYCKVSGDNKASSFEKYIRGSNK